MKAPRPNRKQPRSDEVRDELLRFIQSQFYPGEYVSFAKDRPRLLKWVIWKLAVYLDDKAVTLPTDRYLQIMKKDILIPALQFGDTGNITYVPAYLGVSVERHLKMHGEEVYEEAKASRDNISTYLSAITSGLKPTDQAPDPIREMAAAARLLKPAKRVVKKPLNAQPDLF